MQGHRGLMGSVARSCFVLLPVGVEVLVGGGGGSEQRVQGGDERCNLRVGVGAVQRFGKLDLADMLYQHQLLGIGASLQNELEPVVVPRRELGDVRVALRGRVHRRNLNWVVRLGDLVSFLAGEQAH